MSDTPITNSFKVRFSTLCAEEDSYWVPAKKSAELERELAAAQERASKLEFFVKEIAASPNCEPGAPWHGICDACKAKQLLKELNP